MAWSFVFRPPQGFGIGPILANICPNELDKHMEEYKASFVRATNTAGSRIPRLIG